LQYFPLTKDCDEGKKSVPKDLKICPLIIQIPSQLLTLNVFCLFKSLSVSTATLKLAELILATLFSQRYPAVSNNSAVCTCRVHRDVLANEPGTKSAGVG
jgi:hypothetical protein